MTVILRRIQVNNIKAVIFDLDGVITDTAEYHYKAWKMLADEINVAFDKDLNEHLKGVDRLESLRVILRASNLVYPEDQIAELSARKNGYYVELLKELHPSDLLPGALEALQEMKRLGVKTALASVSKNAPAILEKLQIKEYFDYVADASKIKKGKPDPEIFLTCAENLGFPSDECIGVEDAVAGVTAIRDAGMFCVGIGKPEVLTQANVVIESLLLFDLSKYNIDSITTA